MANDLIWTGVVLRAAEERQGASCAAGDRPGGTRGVRGAAPHRQGAQARSAADAGELEQLRDYFAHRDKRSQIPMLSVMEFALASARREAEICRLEWRDNDERSRTGIVRDAKHPDRRRKAITVDSSTRPKAWAVVQAQPRSSEYIFPYEPESIGAAFTRACHVLGIKDLRFHDLRHEATSRLFERGYQIHEVAQFTLHDSWNELKRYANLKPENVRELMAPAAQDAPHHSRAARSRCLRQLATSTSVDQFGEIERTDEPGRLLSAEPKDAARQHLVGALPASLFITQTEVLGRDARQRNIGFSKFSQ